MRKSINSNVQFFHYSPNKRKIDFSKFQKNKINLLNTLKSSYKLPASFYNVNIDLNLFKHVFKCQLTSRLLDLLGLNLFSQDLSFYKIHSMGHESMAAIASTIKLTDPKLLHYRSGAAFIEWMTRLGDNPTEEVLRSIVSSRYSFSKGRHKTYGSLKASIIPQTSTIASHLPKSVGMVIAIQKAVSAGINKIFPENSLVFCSFGDGSFNHSSTQDALNMIEWYHFNKTNLPLLLVCENNGVSISTKNPSEYVEFVMSRRPAFHYIKIDGSNIIEVINKAQEAEKIARNLKKPVFIDLKTTRIGSHYIENLVFDVNEEDPLPYTAAIAKSLNIMTDDDMTELVTIISQQIMNTAEEIIKEPKCKTTRQEYNFQLPCIDSISTHYSSNQLTLSQSINNTLKKAMKTHSNIFVFGDDVVNERGGIYGTTKDLEKLFGNNRVFNTPIDETFMLAIAQMMGLNGLIPVVEIRHLAYLHNAIDQIRGEASTTSWLSNNQFNTPILLRIPGLGYQISGGHFHNDSSIAAIREIPNIVIVCPSHPGSVKKLFNNCIKICLEQKKVVIFIEPISLYTTEDLYKPKDKEYLNLNKSINPKFKWIGVYGSSKELTIISYGNGFYQSLKAAEEFRFLGINIQVIDLQWLKPLAVNEIHQAINNIPNILIVDEGRKTASISEELYTRLLENKKINQNLSIHRITSLDVFVPLGPPTLSIFPSKEKIINYINKYIFLHKTCSRATSLRDETCRTLF